MKKLVLDAWIKAQITKQRIKDHFSSEEGGADSIIIAVIIIIVVVALAVIFRDAIFGWFKGLSDDASGTISNANFSSTSVPST